MKLARAFCFTVIVIFLFGCGFLDTPAGRIRRAFPKSQDYSLVCAAFSGDKKKVEKLIQEGADINCRGWINMTPVNFAVWQRNKQATQILLELGANPNLLDDEDFSAINTAAGNSEDSWFLETIIKYGGNANSKGKRGTTLAMATESLTNVRILIKAGADLNAQDYMGNTALMEAAAHKHFEVVYYLLEAGADPTIQDCVNSTVLLCIQQGFMGSASEEQIAYREKVIQWLKDHNQWHEEIPPWKQGKKENPSK